MVEFFNGALHGEIPQLTFEQLKAEADRQGYNLVKKRQYVRFLPCTCGCNRRYTFYSMEQITWNVGYKCVRCGKEAFGKSAADAKLNWNEMIWEVHDYETNQECNREREATQTF